MSNKWVRLIYVFFSSKDVCSDKGQTCLVSCFSCKNLTYILNCIWCMTYAARSLRPSKLYLVHDVRWKKLTYLLNCI